MKSKWHKPAGGAHNLTLWQNFNALWDQTLDWNGSLRILYFWVQISVSSLYFMIISWNLVHKADMDPLWIWPLDNLENAPFSFYTINSVKFLPLLAIIPKLSHHRLQNNVCISFCFIMPIPYQLNSSRMPMI